MRGIFEEGGVPSWACLVHTLLLLLSSSTLCCHCSMPSRVPDQHCLASAPATVYRESQVLDHVSKVANFYGSDWIHFTLDDGRLFNHMALYFRTRMDNQLLYKAILRSPIAAVATELTVFTANNSLTVRISSPLTASRDPHQKKSDLTFSFPCTSFYGTCGDTHWHVVRQKVFENVLQFEVDGMSTENQKVPGLSTAALSGEIWIGGTGIAEKETPSHPVGYTSNFRGCFAGTLEQPYAPRNLPILTAKLAKLHMKYIKQGNIGRCRRQLLQPTASGLKRKAVYFHAGKEYDYLRISGWGVTAKADLTFQFQTSNSDGLLVYSSSMIEDNLYSHDWKSRERNGAIPSSAAIGFDVFAVEIRAGQLVCTLNTGSGSILLRPSPESWSDSLVDGKLHSVFIKFLDGGLTIFVNKKLYISYVADINSYKFLNLAKHFYLGGVPESIRYMSAAISPEVWSVRLRQDFLGCLSLVSVNTVPWDVELALKACWADRLQSGKSTCAPDNSQLEAAAAVVVEPRQDGQCEQVVCSNSATCSMEGRCDCTETDYSGTTCNEDPVILSFNGHQWLSVKLSLLPVHSVVEYLRVRFRTRHINGLLFTSHSPSMTALDCLEVLLDSGHIMVVYNFGGDNKKFKHPLHVSDNKWHTVTVNRKERHLQITVDNIPQDYDMPQDSRFLSHKDIILGRRTRLPEPGSLDAFPEAGLPKGDFHGGQSNSSSGQKDFFIGHIKHFIFNGLDFIDVAKRLRTEANYFFWQDKLEVTASEGIQDPHIEYPLTFLAYDSYISVEIPTVKLDVTATFYMQMNKNFGIVLIWDGGESDLSGLEIVNGKLNLVYSDNSGNQRMKTAFETSLLDSRWHLIQFTRGITFKQSITVQVDEEVIVTHVDTLSSPIGGQVFFGGLPVSNNTRTERYKRLFDSSASGFSGCIASLMINHSSTGLSGLDQRYWPGKSLAKSPITAAGVNPTVWSPFYAFHNVEPGCHLHSGTGGKQLPVGRNQCIPSLCQYHGRCLQQLGGTHCDCSLTTFTGHHCDNVQKSIRLSGRSGSWVSYELNPRQNTTRDELAFGVQVVKPAPVVLMSISTRKRSSDFIEISLTPMKGRHIVVVQYNMGAGQQIVYEPSVDFGDGDYHIIQFARHGGSGLIRVDLKHEQMVLSEGKIGIHFDDIQQIYLGKSSRTLKDLEMPFGLPDNSSQTDKQHFDGFVAGVNFNGIDLLQIMNGAVMPGIYLSKRKNVDMPVSFSPRLDKLSQVNKEHLNSYNLAANDMQQPKEDIFPQTKSAQSDPLIVVSKECWTPNGQVDGRFCRPAEPKGIIQPFIEFDSMPSSQGGTKSSKVKKDRNTDPNKHKQPLPNDSGSSIRTKLNTSTTVDRDLQDKAEVQNPWRLNNAPYTVSAGQDLNSLYPLPSDHLNGPTAAAGGGPSNDGIKADRWPSKPRYNFNIGMITSVSIGGIGVLVMLTCLVHRCMRRNEGSYNINESLAYTRESQTPVSRQAKHQPGNRQAVAMVTIPVSSIADTTHLSSTSTAPRNALIVTFQDPHGALAEMPSPRREKISHHLVGLQTISLDAAKVLDGSEPVKKCTTVTLGQTPTETRIAAGETQEWYV